MIEPRETTLLAGLPDTPFTAGQWRAAGQRVLDVHEPALGPVIRTIADTSPSDGVAALGGPPRLAAGDCQGLGARAEPKSSVSTSRPNTP